MSTLVGLTDFQVRTAAVYVAASPDHHVKITNRAGSTLYYKGSSDVSSGSNDGSLAAGDSETFGTGVWLRSALYTDVYTQDELVEAGDRELDGSFEAVNSDEYDGTGSRQTVAADLNVGADAGDDTDTSFLGGVMGNILGDTLTKTANYLGGLIGHYNLTGTKASTYPAGAVLAGIGDGVTEADGAVVAYIDGDSAQTNAGAAFKVKNNNSTAASGFGFALDCQDAAHDDYQPVDSAFYTSGVIRLVEDICFLVGTEAPTNGVTGADVAGKGSLHLNTSDGKLRTNTNTKASPTWTVVGSQS